MSADAIVVFHPSDPSKLEPFLDLDDESEESEGIYAEKLDDGTYLVHTFQPFDVFLENPEEALTWLEQFGDALPDLHDDPRGLAFFPDDLEPAATNYDAVIAEIADRALFVPILEPMVPLQAMTSYDAGKMMEQMQQKIADLLGGMQMPGAAQGEVVDEEFEPDDE
ncbi:MAG: hypothetical protein U0270_21060 [Labilithrix sp.]